MRINLPAKVEYILSALESAGYRADIVGGSVRDFLLGKQPGDYDITTSALPEEVKEVFAKERTVDTGIKHGTVTLVLDGIPYEITTYRFDGEYNDSRHPSSVSFTRRIEDDLMRRDFTVNAMAYSARHGLTDLYGGREDLANRLIRAVGDPDTRFSEDALRILRAVRFAAVLGFDIEKNTAAAISRNMHLLVNVSAERIYIEWRKMLSGDFAYTILCDFSSVFGEIIPELSSLTLPEESLFSEAGYMARMLSLFALSSTTPAESYRSAATGLRMDNSTRDLGISVLSSLDKFDLASDRGITLALKEIGESAARELIALEILLKKATKNTLGRLESLLSKGVVYRLSDLAVNGTDLSKLGIKGREIGSMLDRLLIAVIEGEVPNEHSSLLDYARG
ncbi:MAG: CCA tRNA nucleotidyltransferase [Clostridia bacterium]|nr:CCA tRNA nucleotidyltransferase [Clostridia bacterium]